MYISYNMIREARQQKGYSQEYIAYLLNISQSQYSKLENGVYALGIDMLSRLLDVLEINPLEIIDFSEKQKSIIREKQKNNAFKQRMEQLNLIPLTIDESRAVIGGGSYLIYYKNVPIFATC